MNKPLWGVALACSLALAGLVSPASSAGESQLSVEEEIRQLQALRNELERKTREFDQRIKALEARLQEMPGEGADAAQQSVTVVPALASAPEETPAVAGIAEEEAPETWGRFEPGKGFVLARTDMGELDFSASPTRATSTRRDWTAPTPMLSVAPPRWIYATTSSFRN